MVFLSFLFKYCVPTGIRCFRKKYFQGTFGILGKFFFVFAVLVLICQSRTPFRVLAKMELVIGCYFPKCSIYQMLKAFVSFGKNGEIWQKLCSIKSPFDSKLMQLHTQQNKAKLCYKYDQILS